MSRPKRGWWNGKEPVRKKRGIWCPRHPDAELVRMELPDGKVDLRCPKCTEARRASFKIV